MSEEARPLERGTRARVDIQRVAAGGDGVARHTSGLTVFVDRGLPGDQVSGEIVQRKKRFARLRVDEITAGPHRAPAGCAVAEACGGCRFQHAAYEDEWAWKAEAAFSAVQRMARGVDLPRPTHVASAATVGTRHRARVWLVREDGRLRSGFRRAGAHEVVPNEACPVLALGMDAARADALGLLGDVRGARSLFVEWDAVRGGAAVTFEFDREAFVPALRQLRPRIERTPIPDTITTLAASIVPGRFASEAERTAPRALLGDGRVVRRRPCGEASVDVYDVVSGFSQAHAEGNRALQAAVVAALDDLPREGGVLELFCGSGNLSFPLIGAGWQLDAVEGEGPAVAAAIKAWASVKSPGAGPQRFHSADLRDGVPAPLDARVFEASAIVLDPPRGGLSEPLALQLARHARGRVVYVSCDPPALGRDLARFAAEGPWDVTQLALHDMFPRTAHVEAIAVLTRRSESVGA